MLVALRWIVALTLAGGTSAFIAWALWHPAVEEILSELWAFGWSSTALHWIHHFGGGAFVGVLFVSIAWPIVPRGSGRVLFWLASVASILAFAIAAFEIAPGPLWTWLATAGVALGAMLTSLALGGSRVAPRRFVRIASTTLLSGLTVTTGLITAAGVLFTVLLFGALDGPDFSGYAAIHIMIYAVPVTAIVGVLFLICATTLIVRFFSWRRRRQSEGPSSPPVTPGSRPRTSPAAPTVRRGRPARRPVASDAPRTRTPEEARRAVVQNVRMATPIERRPPFTGTSPFRLFDMMREHPVPWLCALAGFVTAFIVWYHVLGVPPLRGGAYIEVAFIGMPGALSGYGVYWMVTRYRSGRSRSSY